MQYESVIDVVFDMCLTGNFVEVTEGLRQFLTTVKKEEIPPPLKVDLRHEGSD